MAEVAGDWLSTDAREDQSVAAREAQRLKAVEFAQLYRAAFVDNVAGRVLLEHWTRELARKRTPVNAPHTEYAANEAVRTFIEGIYAQIELSRTEGR